MTQKPANKPEDVKSISAHRETSLAVGLGRRNPEALSDGLLIVNADDWGRDRKTTDSILECAKSGAVSSTSAMVFMEDSERAAEIARETDLDAGLHLNFTTPFSAPNCPTKLVERQREVAAYLRRHRLAQAIFNPLLVRSFRYVVEVQVDEYCRLFGAEPTRLDGHHHMHLCSNVVLGRLLPSGTLIRRNFSFQSEEKDFVNRVYRRALDRMLARRHGMVDYFFSIAPLEPISRLQRIFSLAQKSVVEMETHPVNQDEFRFLAGGEIFRWTGNLRIAPPFASRRRDCAATASD